MLGLATANRNMLERFAASVDKNGTGPVIGRSTAKGAHPLRTTSLTPTSGSIAGKTSMCWTLLSVCGAGLVMILIATIPGFCEFFRRDRI